MEQRARSGGCGGRRRGEFSQMTVVAFILMLATCASFMTQASGDTISPAILNGTTAIPTSPTDKSGPTSPGELRPGTASSNATSPDRTNPVATSRNPTSSSPTSSSPTSSSPTSSSPTSSSPTSSSPASLSPVAPGVQTPDATTNPITAPPITSIPTHPTAAPPTSSIQTTASLPTTVGKFTSIPILPTTVGKHATTTRFPTVAGSSKPPTAHQNITASSGLKTSTKTVTPAEYVVEDITRAPSPTSKTARVSATQKENQTKVGITSGSMGELTTALPTFTSIVYETILITEILPVEITAGKENVTLNATMASDGGAVLDPDHEGDELKKLIMIIGVSIGSTVVAITICFAVVYKVAKRRQSKANSRYYNFKKKKKSSYEKVLHLQEYYGEMDPDNSTAGTGAAWVFQENDRDANKTITLEMNPNDQEKQVGGSGKKKKSRNKNKNNRNKGACRGNYQVLAEMFPTPNMPPDVLLSVDGAVYSNSEDDDENDGSITCMETSFGPVMMEENTDSVMTDGVTSNDSFSDGMRSPWPAWNTSPYVTITQEDAVVEL